MRGYYRSDSRTLVGGHLSIDVRQLKRVGRLEPGQIYSCEWENGSNIVIETEPEAIGLFYNISRSGQPHEDVHIEIPLSWSFCNFGGERPWFICPEKSCSRRVAMLYLGRKYFMCRHCCELAYPSQRQVRYYRLLYRSKKILKRFGVNSCGDLWRATRPKGMHNTTYNRLVKQAKYLEDESNQVALSAILHLTPQQLG